MFPDTAMTADSCAVDESIVEFVMDEEAFRAFYERTARGVWAYLARVTGDRQLADDLLQEAYYRFLRANRAHEGETHRRRSLYRIATNLARDVHRNKLRRPLDIAGEEIEAVAPGNQYRAVDRGTDLTRAMSHLQPRERAMLWLAYAEGASHDEISAVLGISIGSIKTLLFRARRKLAGLLGGEKP